MCERTNTSSWTQIPFLESEAPYISFLSNHNGVAILSYMVVTIFTRAFMKCLNNASLEKQQELWFYVVSPRFFFRCLSSYLSTLSFQNSTRAPSMSAAQLNSPLWNQRLHIFIPISRIILWDIVDGNNFYQRLYETIE